MYTRLVGCDTEVGFSPEMLDVVRRAEERFPAPEWAVIFADSDPEVEDDVDQLIVCHRMSGVLMPVAYVGIDELAEYENTDTDWMSQLRQDLERTEAEIEKLMSDEAPSA